MTAATVDAPPGERFAWATVGHKESPVQSADALTWPEIVAALTTHKIGRKDGPGFLPAAIEPGRRLGERVGHVSLLVLDIEADAENVKADDGTEGKRVTGPLPPTLPAMAAELELWGLGGVLATSWSHEGPTIDGGTAGPRYRLVLKLSRPIEPAEVKPLCEAVAAMLGVADCIDTGCFEPARLFYLPRCPAERRHLAEAREVQGRPLDVDALLRAAAAAKAPKPTKPAGTTKSASVIEAFNAAHDIGAIIESHGYEAAGRNRYKWPGSTTGVAGVVTFDTGRLYSHHTLDPLHEREHGRDAFGAWCILAHGGDVSAAVREAARLLGMAHESGIGGSVGSVGSDPASEPENSAPDWPEPTPLPDALPPVPAFDPELLPEALRAWVSDIADRMQCPTDFLAVGALVALSSLIGARAVIQPKARDDWRVVPNLWGAIVGRPGVLKSPALAEVLKPLHALEAAESEAGAIAQAQWAIDCKVQELQADQDEKTARKLIAEGKAGDARVLLAAQEKAPEPVPRRFIVNDATVERLGELLAANPWGLLAYRDELYGLLRDLDKPQQESARGFYLTAYDGDKPHKFDRIIRGLTHIPRVCLAMLGSIQPSRVHEYVRAAVAGGTGDDGLLQRFGLIVWPDVGGEFRNVDQFPDAQAKRLARAVFDRLAALAPAQEQEPHLWRFDAPAQELFNEWRAEHERLLRSGQLHPALESHLAKYRKLIPALALIFALIDTPAAVAVGLQELLRALAWGEYLRSHAERLYSAAVQPETTAARALLVRIQAGRLGDAAEFTPRDVARKGWAGLNTPQAVRAAADTLADFDWLRRVVSHPSVLGGRPSESYRINPAAIGARA